MSADNFQLVLARRIFVKKNAVEIFGKYSLRSCFTLSLLRTESHVTRELSAPPTGGVHPFKTFLTPQHRPPSGGVNNSYTYPDRVFSAIGGYWSNLHYHIVVCIRKHSFIRFKYSAATPPPQ